jgi:hypothetical protein
MDTASTVNYPRSSMVCPCEIEDHDFSNADSGVKSVLLDHMGSYIRLKGVHAESGLQMVRI